MADLLRSAVSVALGDAKELLFLVACKQHVVSRRGNVETGWGNLYCHLNSTRFVGDDQGSTTGVSRVFLFCLDEKILVIENCVFHSSFLSPPFGGLAEEHKPADDYKENRRGRDKANNESSQNSQKQKV